MLNIIKKYPEAFFVAKFLLLFFCIYYFFELFIGLASPGNHYSSFVANHFNIIKWYRVSILKTTECISNLFGYKAQLLTSIKLEGFNGYRVNMVYSCIGYGILSFWFAFSLTYPTIKSRIKWLLIGFFLLWFTNVVRVLLLLLAINKSKDVNSFSKHHLAYNIATYIIVFVLIYFFTKEKLKK